MPIKLLKDSSGRLYTDAITKKPISVDMSLPALSNPATSEGDTSITISYRKIGIA